MYDAIDDPYTYAKSTVLVNKLDLRDQDELDAYEAEIPSARADEPLPEGNLNFAHHKAVHHHLFQDVYEWAGQVRTVRMFKGGNPFCFPENIEKQAAKLFGELQADNFLHGLDGSAFADKAAHFLAELNAIHAFREGNGRSQLTFFVLLADDAGYSIELDKLDPSEMLDAVLRRRRIDADRHASADAVLRRVGIDDGSQPKKQKQLAIKLAGGFEIRHGQENMRDAVDFHRLPLRQQNDFGKNSSRSQPAYRN